MSKDWRDVKDKIESEIDKIWWEQPKEVRMSRLNVYPSGAGHSGQVLGNLLFLQADLRLLSDHCAAPMVRAALADPDFTLDQVKKIWKTITLHRARLLGGTDPPRCPYPWLNLGKVHQFATEIVDSLDSIRTKDEFADLLWSWFNYVNRLATWFHFVMPWGIAKFVSPRIEPEHIQELAYSYGLSP